MFEVDRGAIGSTGSRPFGGGSEPAQLQEELGSSPFHEMLQARREMMKVMSVSQRLPGSPGVNSAISKVVGGQARAGAHSDFRLSRECSEHRRENRRGTPVGAYQPKFFDFRQRRRQAHLIASRRYAERGGQPESGFMAEKKALRSDKKVISFLTLRASVHQCKLPIVTADASAPKDGRRNAATGLRIKQRETPSWFGGRFRCLSVDAWHSMLAAEIVGWRSTFVAFRARVARAHC
jgi:hypothetical protein